MESEIIIDSIRSETGRLLKLLSEARKGYAEKRIIVELIKNNGKYNGYSNKCILLALRDSFTLYGIEHDLSTYTNFHHDKMFDIDNRNHLLYLKDLLTRVANTFRSNLICYFYYVNFEGDIAFVSPEFKVQVASQTNFKASKILRIANYPGYHFEAIIPSVYDQFIDEPIDNAHERLEELQRQLSSSNDKQSVSNMSFDDLSTQYLLLQDAKDKLRLQQQKDKLEAAQLTNEYLASLGVDLNEQKTLLFLSKENKK
jgi:hypothetical protein